MPRPRPFAGRPPESFAAAIGCDEVGRGALAGPVVACALWFDPAALPEGLLDLLDDSKRLTRRQRERLATELAKVGRAGFAYRSAATIDRIDIRQATLAAMVHAVARVRVDAAVLLDGRDVPAALAARGARGIVGGDGRVPQIAGASILAKVARDRLMARLALAHPHYGWERNAGYGTALHRAALATHGPTPHHRRSFGSLRG